MAITKAKELKVRSEIQSLNAAGLINQSKYLRWTKRFHKSYNQFENATTKKLMLMLPKRKIGCYEPTF